MERWEKPEPEAEVEKTLASTSTPRLMALSIKNPEADRLARKLARATGESLTDAVLTAVRERLVRETGRNPDTFEADIARIVAEVARLPILDDRTPEEIIGYDENGLPS